MRVSATEFEAHCLRLIDRIAQTREEVVVTKDGKPVARLLPVLEAAEVDAFGCMAGSVVRMGDIVGPVGGAWRAEQS